MSSLADETFGGSVEKSTKTDAFAYGTSSGNKSKNAYILVYDRGYKSDLKFEYNNDDDEKYIGDIQGMSLEELHLKRRTSSHFSKGSTGDGSGSKSKEHFVKGGSVTFIEKAEGGNAESRTK